MSEESKVRTFYTGKNFFITGGTGFVGICLIEKILRCIPDVGKVYLLMRPKKGKEISERLKEFHTNPIFEKLLEKETVDVFNKLVPIAGDVGSEDLAISPADRQSLIDNVNVVIHSAATLDFEESLRPTVNINILGTRRITELCQQIKNLKVLVHVSSAYVNSYLTETTEKLYDAPADVEKVIELSKNMSDQALLDIEKEVLKDHPNTYTFTKHLAEHEVNRCADKFPCTIVRPSMIVASWKEPVPGWTCSKVGPQGFLMGASKGVVRRLPMCETNIADYIPVDVVVNELLVAGWKAASTERGLSIYQCTSSTQRPFRWGSLNEMINSFMHENPLKSAVWYPHLSFVSSLLMFRISAIFVHFLPAVLLDTVLRLTGGKPILFRLHKNVWNSLGRLERFIFTEWRFHNEQSRRLALELSPADQGLFYIDISDLNWDEFFRNLYMGVRKYLNRESEKTIPAARSKDRMLYYAHVVWQVLVIWLLWVAVATLLRATLLTTPWAPVLIYVLYSFL